jgi:hypothetical protein
MPDDPFAMPMTVNSVERSTAATGLDGSRGWGYSWPDRFLCRPMNNRSKNGNDEADQRRSTALIGLIIILALAIAGVWLVRELREKSRLEDCLMSGRTNCAPIEVPSRR